MSKSKLSQFRLHYEHVGLEFRTSQYVDSLLERIVNKVRSII